MKTLKVALRRPMAAASALVVAVALAGCSVSDTGGGNDESTDGMRTGPGVSDDEIRIGNLSAWTGPIAVFGEAYVLGVDAYFERVNAEGGIAGRQLVSVVEDSGYDPQTALTAYRAIRDDVLAISATMGSPVTDGIRQVSKEDDMLAVIGGLNTEYAADSNFIIPSETYRVDAVNAVDWYLNEQGGQEGDKIAVLYQDDTYGRDAHLGIEYAAETYGLDLVAEVSYSTSTQDFTPQVTQLKRSDPDFVFVTPLGNQLGPYLTTASSLGFTPLTAGSGTSWSAALKGLPETAFQNYHPVAGIPIVGIGDDEASQQMLEDVEAVADGAVAPDMVTGLAYLHAVVLVKILQDAAENGDLTREGVLQAAQDLTVVDTGGLTPELDYTPSNDMRVGLRASRVFDVDFSTDLGIKVSTDYFTSDAAADDEFENISD